MNYNLLVVKMGALNEETLQIGFLQATWLFTHIGVGGLRPKRASVKGGGIGVVFIGLRWAVESYSLGLFSASWEGVVGCGSRG